VLLACRNRQLSKPGVNDPSQSGRLPPFASPERFAVPAHHQRTSSRRQWSPDHVRRSGVAIGNSGRRLASCHKRRDPRRRRTVTNFRNDGTIDEVENDTPMSPNGSNTVNTQFVDCCRRGRRTNQVRCGFKRIDARIVEGFGRRTNAFDINSVNLMDLSDQQVNQRVVRKFDTELIDWTSGAALENVDTSHIAANRADSTRQCA
jgi:hypothetical protein